MNKVICLVMFFSVCNVSIAESEILLSNKQASQAQERGKVFATVNNFNPKSDADYRNTGIPYQYRELSEPTDRLLAKVNDWLNQHDSVEKLGALGKISSQTVEPGLDDFLYADKGTVETLYVKYDDGMDIWYMVINKSSGEVYTRVLAINNIVSSDLIQRLTGFKIGQKMVDIRNKLGSPHMISRGKKPNERIYFYLSYIHDNPIVWHSVGSRGNEISSFYSFYASDFYRTKDERLALARRSQLSNFSAVYDENYKNPLKYGDDNLLQPTWRALFSFDENNLLKQVDFYFDPN